MRLIITLRDSRMIRVSSRVVGWLVSFLQSGNTETATMNGSIYRGFILRYPRARRVLTLGVVRVFRISPISFHSREPRYRGLGRRAQTKVQ